MALISEAKAAVEDPTAPNKQLRLAQAAKAVSQALNQACLPSLPPHTLMSCPLSIHAAGRELPPRTD